MLTDRQRDLIERHADLPAKVARAVVKRGDIEEAESVATSELVLSAQAFEDQCEFGAFAYNRMRWKLLKWIKGNDELSLDFETIEGCPMHQLVADKRQLAPDEIAEYREEKASLIARAKQDGGVTLTECLEKAPAPTGLGSYYATMRKTICDAVTASDVQEIMKTMVGKAKSGDIGAAKLVLAQVAGQAPRITQNVQVTTVTIDSKDD